jgi:glycine oxidase
MSNQTHVDHIIVGLGLAGAALALQLIARGKKIVVFDEPADNRASRVAAGLFNPISGKLMVKTWRADDLFPYLTYFYRNAEQITSQKFFHPRNIYIPFRSIEEQNNWATLSDDPAIKIYVSRVYTSSAFDGQVNDDLGGVLLDKCGYLQVGTFLDAVRDLLQGKACLFGKMKHDRLELNDDTVRYDSVIADSIVFCEGLHGRDNPITSWLPVSPLKGETIDVRFSRELGAIYNRGIYAVPLGDRHYRVGATFDRSIEQGNTAQGREELEHKLRSLIRVPYEVVSQNWGFRPTTRDRKPTLGPHPEFRNVFIFNGMGTKGVSQAPYFSMILADYLQGKVQIGAEVNISRFYALSSKSRD